jgi:hypothetical protein
VPHGLAIKATYYAPIRSIDPWQDTGKIVINFAEPAREIAPLKLTKNGRVWTRHSDGVLWPMFGTISDSNFSLARTA